MDIILTYIFSEKEMFKHISDRISLQQSAVINKPTDMLDMGCVEIYIHEGSFYRKQKSIIGQDIISGGNHLKLLNHLIQNLLPRMLAYSSSLLMFFFVFFLPNLGDCICHYHHHHKQ